MVYLGDANFAVKPFGAIDTPGQGGIAYGSKYIVWGWALTPQPDREMSRKKINIKIVPESPLFFSANY